MLLTAKEIRRTLVKMIVSAAGGRRRRWKAAIGQVEVLPLTMMGQANWRVSPQGNHRQRDLIERAAAALREAQPFAKTG